MFLLLLLFLLLQFLAFFLFVGLFGSEDHCFLPISKLDDINQARVLLQLGLGWEDVLSEVRHTTFAVFQVFGGLFVLVGGYHGFGIVRKLECLSVTALFPRTWGEIVRRVSFTIKTFINCTEEWDGGFMGATRSACNSRRKNKPQFQSRNWWVMNVKSSRIFGFIQCSKRVKISRVVV